MLNIKGPCKLKNDFVEGWIRRDPQALFGPWSLHPSQILRPFPEFDRGRAFLFPREVLS